MKLYNKCGNGLSHTLFEGNTPKFYFLANDAIGEIPDEIAKIWLKFDGVTEYVSPEDMAKLKAENEALKAEKTAKKAEKIAKKASKKK